MKSEKDKIRKKSSNECGLELDYFWCCAGTLNLAMWKESEITEKAEVTEGSRKV